MRELIRALRPKQWSKNVLVFAGLVFDQQLFDSTAFIQVALCFLYMSMLSSAVYLINDLVDIESDKQHPIKRNRPLASGSLSPQVAQLTATCLLIVSLLGSYFLSIRLLIIFLLYLLIQIFYNAWLKKILIVDILVISTGFVLRVAAGTVIIQVAQFSPWLYVCTALLALYLVIGKRRQDLILLKSTAKNSNTGYKSYPKELLDDLMRITTASTLIAYIIYTIEIEHETFAGVNLALITSIFVFYSLMRYSYLINQKNLGSSPEEILFLDKPLQFSIFLWAMSNIFILYILPLVATT